LTFFSDAFYIEAMTTSEARGFDPREFYAFDLARGAVSTRHGERMLVLSSDAVATLVASAAKHGDLTAVRALGKRIGEEAQASLASDVRGASPEAVATHAAGVLSLLGWGAFSFERWGHALVIVLEGAPELDPGKLGLASLLGGMLTALSGRDIACVPVSSGRFVVVHPSVAEQVFTWSTEGSDLAQIVAKLGAEGLS